MKGRAGRRVGNGRGEHRCHGVQRGSLVESCPSPQLHLPPPPSAHSISASLSPFSKALSKFKPPLTRFSLPVRCFDSLCPHLPPFLFFKPCMHHMPAPQRGFAGQLHSHLAEWRPCFSLLMRCRVPSLYLSLVRFRRLFSCSPSVLSPRL